jgi:uncharacterized protein
VSYYVLRYDLIEDYLERRAALRDEHLRLATAAFERGELILAGALSDPVDQALLVFHTPDRAVVEAFARDDPYVVNGLVTHWEVRDWTVVVGNPPSAPGTQGGTSN